MSKAAQFALTYATNISARVGSDPLPRRTRRLHSPRGKCRVDSNLKPVHAAPRLVDFAGRTCLINGHQFDSHRFAVFTTQRPRTPVEGPSGPSIDVSIDFTRPDGQRTRPLMVENKRLYVDEHYISVWSPVLRAWCVECPDRELILANVQYDHVVEMLECIHPTYKSVDDQSVHILLPLAYDYQMDGLLHRCECFLINHNLPFLEKVWIADR
ncbi:BTB/POZ domain protein [Oesophagostomum dentatum]|uniref:BTB/POZ domain protein n=1 Tax=Oesophagostomum dentatum TaxID=61180 RepID=A0A0B1TR20_OESDE|nr:BTB/POZ domain protein [Oesophagostomum dentatum]